ncbi:MAG TPA: DUF488 domain-containing protein [Gemmatimonadaceae bacterium]|nr:DUF488 domain-containing protein [Gemmatimonadaceae bacterium]
MPARSHPVATVGYQGTTVPQLLDTLRDARVALLVDVRAVTSSRRPGFSKSQLAAALADVGIDYLHLRALGTPADGRAAVRAGRPQAMHAIYREHLTTRAAQDELATLAELVRGGRRVCLLCYEADPTHCHRTLVAEAVGRRLPVRVTHLHPGTAE